jgi:hypothetical protein
VAYINEPIQDDLKFEALIAEFTEPEKFLARQVRAVQKECTKRGVCPQGVSFTRKQMLTGIGGVTGISAIVVALIELAKALITGG